MRLKRRLIFMAVVAAIAFGASYFVSVLLRPDPPAEPVAVTEEDPKDQAWDNNLEAMSASVSMKERELDELIREVRQKIEACKKRQDELDKQETRLRLAGEELAQQAQELEALRVELVAPLTRIREAVAELENTRIRISSEEQVNLKRIAGVCEKMDSASGSEMLSRMCSNNQESDAVKILRYMSERSAGKLLSEMSDKELAARLCGELKRVEEEG